MKFRISFADDAVDELQLIPENKQDELKLDLLLDHQECVDISKKANNGGSWVLRFGKPAIVQVAKSDALPEVDISGETRRQIFVKDQKL